MDRTFKGITRNRALNVILSKEAFGESCDGKMREYSAENSST
jgi:hypothetical protein